MHPFTIQIMRFQSKTGWAVIMICLLAGPFGEAIAAGAARSGQSCASVRQCKKYQHYCCEHPATAAVCTELMGPTACAYQRPVLGSKRLLSSAPRPQSSSIHDWPWLRTPNGLLSPH